MDCAQSTTPPPIVMIMFLYLLVEVGSYYGDVIFCSCRCSSLRNSSQPYVYTYYEILFIGFWEGVGLCYWVWIALVIYWSKSISRLLYLLHNIREMLVLPLPLFPIIMALGILGADDFDTGANGAG